MSYQHGLPFEMDFKAIGDEGLFEGYAATFGNVDLGRDIVVPGAFAKSLASRPPHKVKMFRDHDLKEPVGIWLDLAEDTKGLRAKGKIILDTVKGKETHALMRAGALDSLSIGYKTIRDHFDRAKGVRYLDEVLLGEISIVSMPMNPAATVSRVKSDEQGARALVAAINRVRESIQ